MVVPVKTEHGLKKLCSKVEPEGVVLKVFCTTQKCSGWWSKLREIFHGIHKLHLVVLVFPFVDALPESPPEWEVSDNCQVDHWLFDSRVPINPISSREVCHCCSKIHQRLSHAGNHIGQKEITKSYCAKWAYQDLIKRLKQLKSRITMRDIQTRLHAYDKQQN